MRLATTASRALRRIESTTTSTTCARGFGSRQHQHEKHPLSRPNIITRSFCQSSPPATNHGHVVAPRSSDILPATCAISTRRIQTRTLHTTNHRPSDKRSSSSSAKPKLAHNNEPIPTEAPQTNFSQMDMLGQTPVPSTSIDVCHHDGFTFNSGAVISNGDGALLVGGEAFSWRPWDLSPLINSKGQFEFPAESLGVFELVWPRPDLLIIGMGKEIRPLSPETRKLISQLGMRVDVLDTRNAASQFNMLATERGVDEVAALLVPLGWKP